MIICYYFYHRLPDEYVYEPWRAPLEVQEVSRCVVGKDYPHPMIDYDSASTANMELIRTTRNEFLALN